MRYKFKIVEKGNINEKEMFIVHIEKQKFDLWYKEQMRRFGEMTRNQEVNLKVFDIDESMGVGQMSYGHFEAMIEFLFNK